MKNLTEENDKKNKPAEKKLKLDSKRAIDLLLSLLGNRGMTYQKLSNPGKAYEDASLGIEIHSNHSKDFNDIKMSWAKLHYRRMISIDALLDMSSKKIKNCRSELLKIEMLGNILIYLVELVESCGIVISNEQNSISGKKAKSLKNKYNWMNEEYNKLKIKQKKNADFSKKVRNSMKEIPKVQDKSETTKITDLEKNKSIAQIALKAMESLIKSDKLAQSASEFERQMDSFKENPIYLSKYLFKYSSEQIKKIYSKRAIEAHFVLKIISSLNELTEEKDLKEAGRIMEVILNLEKSVLTFKMMIKRERRELRDLLEKINNKETIERLTEYKKKFRLPEN